MRMKNRMKKRIAVMLSGALTFSMAAGMIPGRISVYRQRMIQPTVNRLWHIMRQRNS